MEEQSKVPDLWPQDLFSGNERTPVEILRVQATQLSEKSGHLLEARVESRAATKGGQFREDLAIDSTNNLIHRFIVRAPALGNYEYELLYVVNPPGLYPCMVGGPAIEGALEAADESTFIQALEAVLSSRHTKRVLGAMMRQSRSTGDAA